MSTPPLLLLPGTLCTGAVFTRQVEALNDVCSNIRCVEFPLESSIEAMSLVAFRHIEEGEKVAAAGFSMGGMVALELASRYPDRIDRVALINSNCHADMPARRDRRQRYVEEARRGSLRDVLERGFLGNYLHHQGTADRRLILEMADAHGLAGFSAQSEALGNRRDHGDTLRALDCPLLLIGSRHDVLCPPAVQEEMRDMARNARLVMLEDSGHFSLLEQATEVSAALRDWYLAGPRQSSPSFA